MPVPADGDDKWLHRLIREVELTADNKIHPAAWERFKPDRRVPQWKYVLSGSSWKIGKDTFLVAAANAVAQFNQTKKGPIYKVTLCI